MHTRSSLMTDLANLGIDKKGTLLVHSSMKSIGKVDGGADAVLDALSEYMQEGLLVLPTHTWEYVNAKNPRFYVQHSKSCVGILTEMFRTRPGVVRSWHPTHSVAALGKDAEAFVAGDEQFDTPCARGSVWGKLLVRKAAILFIGVSLTCNTFIHGVEEWADVPNRITEGHEPLYVVTQEGSEISVPSRRHFGLTWSDHFWKVEDLFLANNIMKKGYFGSADILLCDTVGSADLLFKMLEANIELFSDNNPLDEQIYQMFRNS